ncbi:hypothetical protein V9T40_001099 [Parthenolecanium corni]|uniref:CRAL-TRIO domain-containing protein n=1 Tax=Parthenolecanium corni TaxID=536013 RepID=A0AAN9TB00_9HEMI
MVFDVSLKTDKVKAVTMIYDFQNISMAFFKSFFTTLRLGLAIQSLVIWSKDVKELPTALPKDCLPEEYGGSLPNIGELFDVYYDYAKEYYDWLGEQNDIKADLNQKIENISTTESLQGLIGSFRKVSID